MFRKLARYAISLPPDLLAWAILVLLRPLAGKRLVVKHGCLALELRPGWFRNLYGNPETTPKGGFVRGATTLGPHAVLFNLGELDLADIWQHELVHVEQYESEAVQNAVLTAFLSPWGLGPFVTILGLAWWTLGGLLAMLAGYATAFLRNEPTYRGSHFEEAAYDRVSCRRQVK
jgi:hypothetical protein